jgi:hypothetical protein
MTTLEFIIYPIIYLLLGSFFALIADLSLQKSLDKEDINGIKIFLILLWPIGVPCAAILIIVKYMLISITKISKAIKKFDL